jgi:hypothetical protein
MTGSRIVLVLLLGAVMACEPQDDDQCREFLQIHAGDDQVSPPGTALRKALEVKVTCGAADGRAFSLL